MFTVSKIVLPLWGMLETNLVRIFTGNKVEADLLKGTLEESGITTIVRNDFEAGTIAGFGGGFPSMIDLYIHQDDLNRAEEIIENFSK
jgi:hypothetical protein